MASLEKSLRNQLERTVKDARDVAEAAARSALEQLGVGDAGPPSHLSAEERDLRRRLRIHGRQLGDQTDDKKKTQELDRLIEEVGYEHWHRMLFARFLAENNLLMYDDSVKFSVFSVQQQLKTESLNTENLVAISLEEAEDLAIELGLRNKWDLAARLATRMLPQIFRIESPIFEIQLPPEHQQQLEKFISKLPADVFTASDSLGWVYQFWQARRKDQVNASEVKIGARELPAVTQLFTEDYMVDFLLDNTLGAWHAGKSGGSFQCSVFSTEDEVRRSLSLPGCPWTYLRFTKSESLKTESLKTENFLSENWTPAAGTFEGWPTTAKELKCLDPCMGSGHFVVAMFERLVALRMAEEKLDEAEAVAAVIRENLFGLEIDPRCTQIAAFNVALAAWRRVGYCTLPPMNLACSGLAPNTSEEEWLKLAGGNEKLENGMARLYQLFENAPVLGSLINPSAGQSELLEAGFHELQPLLEKALTQETKDNAAHEMAVTACGLAKAAEILASQFSIVATNVPYLGIRKQCETLKKFVTDYFPEAKECLSTVFCARMSHWLNKTTMAVVAPQNWFYQFRYRNHRAAVLENESIQLIARLGEGGFESSQAAGAFAALSIITGSKPKSTALIRAIDASEPRLTGEKAVLLEVSEIKEVAQKSQLLNPDARLSLERPNTGRLLNEFVVTAQGIKTGDDNFWVRCFWEISPLGRHWRTYQTATETSKSYAARSWIINWKTQGVGMVRPRTDSPVVGKIGVVASAMREISVTIYTGDLHYSLATPLIPLNFSHLSAIWAFCSSPDYNKAVREIEQNIAVTTDTLAKVPFDLAHWQKVAAEKYPHGLPKPFSSDPTQWLFDGHPHSSDNPLQVAVPRLVGYKWPRQTGSSFPDCPALGPDGLESLADEDGIVCIPPVRGEASAADRLLDLMAKAYGHSWSSDVLPGLLKDAGYAGKSLETWLRDGFFQQHCELFHQRPFIWQIWDGLRDGFSALVNYHKLDRKNLETLIYTYLGDWMTRQSQDATNGIDGAQEKLSAAEQLKKRLELILTGEAPHGIFVRWKSLHQQPIGWEPDLNDGVRMNIRPFLSVPDIKAKGAGILRVKPKIKWEKDRGKEPQRSKEDYPWFWGWDEKTIDFTGVGAEPKGERFNDCHYTVEFKRQARERAKKGDC